MEINDIFSLGELFEQVQLQSVFPDGKTFVDCTPNAPLSSIHDRYTEEKTKPGFSLPDFVHRYFTEPVNEASLYESVPGMPLPQHLEELWDVLTRKPSKSTNSLIPLPFPYIVPGGRFREIYYWDSYFTMLGLQVSGRADLIENMIDNFSYLIDQFGYIPNGNRRYYLGRSQPPFFAGMVKILCEVTEEKNLVKYLPKLEKEYAFWMKGAEELTAENRGIRHTALMPDGSILNHYWDVSDIPRPEAYKKEIELAQNATNKNALYRHLRAAAESGWDFSSRWFKDKTDFSTIHAADIIPVDLNCLILDLENTIARGHELRGNEDATYHFQQLAMKRKAAIDRYCWNEESGFYFDYDFVENTQKVSMTLAAAFPLFYKIATEAQAKSVANIIAEKFLCAGGLVSTTITTDQQWDSPNGWAPLQWISIKGLDQYGHSTLAQNIAHRWMSVNENVYNNTGKMMEKYNVSDVDLKAGGGEYPAQDGFGWSNGVYLALKKWLHSKNA
jgi:alpha,alpha-trehalase